MRFQILILSIVESVPRSISSQACKDIGMSGMGLIGDVVNGTSTLTETIIDAGYQIERMR